VIGRRAPALAPTDLPVLFLLCSALAAVWPAFDRASGWRGAAAVAAGALVYAAASRLRAAGPAWRALGGASVVAGAALGAYFIFQFPRLGYAEKSAVVERAAAWLGSGAPAFGHWAPDRNSVATCLEGLVFLGVALASTRKGRLARVLWGAAVAIAAAAIALSASRGAALAVAAAGTVWAAIRLKPVAARPALASFLVALPLLSGLVWLAAVVWEPGAAAGLETVSPALDRPDRVALYQQSAWLIRDAPFTGIGIGSQFAMSLSRYALLIQVPFLTYSHNLYLETWLELGLAGAAALVWLVAAYAAGFKAIPQIRHGALAQGAGCGVLAVLLHGLVDARPFVDSWSGLPVFVLLGLFASAVSAAETPPMRRRRRRVSAAAVCGFVLCALIAVRPAASSWHANLGAVAQATAELSADASDAERRTALQEAERRFHQALGGAPEQVTANLRLALIDMDDGRFGLAVTRAETAWRGAPNTLRTRKAFGLASMWTGDLDRARVLLESVPGIVAELNAWGWWRQDRQEPSLALRAYRTSLLLDPGQTDVRRAAESLARAGSGDR